MTDEQAAVEMARAIEKVAAGFAGRFFYDGERGDLAYIAKDCDDKVCDCEVKRNADGDQDCAVSVGFLDGIDDVGEPIARMLNAVGLLATALIAISARHAAAMKIVEAAEWWAGDAARPPWANKNDRMLFDAIDAWRAGEGKT